MSAKQTVRARSHRRRGVDGTPARRAFRSELQVLEERTLLAGTGSVFAHLAGEVRTSQVSDSLAIQVSASDFVLPRGRVALSLAVRSDSSNPAPKLVQLVRQGPGSAPMLQVTGKRANLDIVQAKIGVGTYGLTIRSRTAGTGAYHIDVALAGDADGNFRVDAADLGAIRALRSVRANDPRYVFAADLDRNGKIDARDQKLARVNLGVTTTVRPIFARLSLSPGDDIDGSGTVNRSDVTLVGQTSAGAPVQLDQGSDGSFEQQVSAEEDGSYRFVVAVGLGPTSFRVAAADRFGQRATATTTLTRIAPVIIPSPQVQAALANDTAPGGTTNSDGITTDPTVVGTVVSTVPLLALKAGLDSRPEASSVDILGTLGPDGRFRLDRARLEQIAGGVLGDGLHTLHIVAVNSGANSPARIDQAFTLDTTPPPAPAFDLDQASDTAPVGDRQTTLPAVTLAGTTEPGVGVLLGGSSGTLATSVANPAGAFAFAGVALALGSNDFTIRATDLAGNESHFSTTITRSTEPVASAARVAEVSPANGETSVSVTREAIVRFSEAIDPSTVNADSFYLLSNGIRVPGTIRVSSTELFATFFESNPLPPSTEVRIVVDGARIKGRNGLPLDADGDGKAGGLGMAQFRTLPLARIPGTDVSGRVVDATYRNDDGSAIPLAGVTIRVDGFPEANVVTGADGRFTMHDMPAPSFFVHIDGSTATNAPAGTFYPSVGKPFMSVPGQSVVMAMNGVPFDIYLPRIDLEDIRPLSATETTDVGFGEEGKEQLEELFPAVDPVVWERLHVSFSPGVAFDDQGNVATEAAVIPVPANRLPAPLPPGLNPQLVISIQPVGATNFDTPVPVVFPNLEGLAPGEQSLIWSFNHDAGLWVVDGTGTVSADGLVIVSDPGMGIRAPGWHFSQSGDCAGSGGAPPMVPPADLTGDQERSVVLPLIVGETGAFPTLVFNAPGGGTPPEPADCQVPVHDVNPADSLVVDIQIDGPIALYMKQSDNSTEAIASSSFTLSGGSGQQRTFGLTALPLKSVASGLGAPGNGQVGNLNDNVLFASQITITETTRHANGTADRRVTHYFVDRFIDATDVNHGDGALEFEDTLLGVTRSKPLKVMAGSSAEPNLSLTEAQFDLGGDTVKFLPNTIGPNQTGTLQIRTPAGDVVGQLALRGQGLDAQDYFVDFSNLSNPENLVFTLQDLFQRNILLPEEKAIFGDPDGSGGFSFSLAKAQFFGILVGSRLEFNLADFGAGTRRINSAGFSTIDFNSFADQPNETGIAGTDVVDHVNGQYSAEELLRNRVNYSIAEQNFRLSKALNSRPTGQVDYFLSRLILGKHTLNGAFTDQNEIADEIARTLAHEFGHAVGMPHANSLPNGSLDYMFQGNPLGTQSNWGVSANAMRVALGLDFTLEQGQQAVDYVTLAYRNDNPAQAPGDALPGDRDQNTGVAVTFNGGLIWSFEGTTGGFTDAIDFGLIDVATGAAARQIRVVNLGDRPATFATASLSGDPVFSVAGIVPGQVLAPGATAILTVSFDPAGTGQSSANLRIASDALRPELSISIKGFGTSSAASAAVEVVDNNLGGVSEASGFAVVPVLARIVNRGSAPLQISDVRLKSGAGRFTLTGLPSFIGGPITLGFGESLSFGARFDPVGLGLDRATIEVVTNDPAQPVLRLSAVGTGLPALVYPQWGSDYVVAETTVGGEPLLLRTRSNLVGDFSLSLPANQRFDVTIFDPETGLVAQSFGKSVQSGRGIDLTSSLVFRASDANDSDFDGLPDDIERAVATSALAIDSDADGVDDFTEVTQGQNPIDGVAQPAGILSSVGLLGPAQEVALAGSFAYVATGTHGLAIVDVSQSSFPIVLGQLALPGGTVDVAVDPVTNIAAVVSNDAGLHLVDVSDPMQPKLRKTLDIVSRRVVVDQGTAYVSTGEDLVIVDLATATIVQELVGIADFFPIEGMAIDAGYLYTYAIGPGTLTIIDVSRQGFAQVRKTFPIEPASFSPIDLAVDDGVAYLVAGGVITIDVSNPDSPTVISTADAAFTSGESAALSGSGLLLNTLGTEGLRTIDVSNPQDTSANLGTINLPGNSLDVQVSAGLAFVAADTAGLLIVNAAGPDTAGTSPILTIASSIPDADPTATGFQIPEGATIPLRLAMRDDVQTARVELLVNGQVMGVFRQPPYDLHAVAPLIGPGVTTVALQVRAVDTGGNVGLSTTLVFELRSDNTGPAVIRTDPAAGGVLRRDSIRIDFNEPIDPALLQNGGITLTHLGADHAPGGGDDTTVGGLIIATRSDDHVLLIQSPTGLANGDYRLSLAPGAISDRAGNALPAPLVLAFQRQPQIGDIAFGQEITGAITQAGERAMFTFQGTAGHRIYFDSLIPRTPGGNDLEMRILAPSGQTVLSNIIGSDTDQGPRALAETGTYTVIIDENADSTGEFAFRILDVNALPLINFGDVIGGTVTLESDLYRFSGTAGQSVVLDFLPGTTFAGGGLELYQPNNSLVRFLVFDEDGDEQRTLPATGDYVLIFKQNLKVTDPIVATSYSFRVVTA